MRQLLLTKRKKSGSDTLAKASEKNALQGKTSKKEQRNIANSVEQTLLQNSLKYREILLPQKNFYRTNFFLRKRIGLSEKNWSLRSCVISVLAAAAESFWGAIKTFVFCSTIALHRSADSEKGYIKRAHYIK